jgi:amidohydrolase
MDELISIRKHLHAHPEISGEEKQTSEFIYNELKNHSRADEIQRFECNAVIARFKGKNEGKTIMIRADMDALPIQETNNFDHKSKFPGKSHKCGHDGHTTILIGLARKLSEQPMEKGEVILLFQPAEENGHGAKAVIDDPYFQELKIDLVFALHNLPGYPKHQIVIREKQFNANVTSMIISLKGRTAHAGEPENGENPSLTIAKLLIIADKLVKNDDEAEDFFLITPIHIEVGEKAYGISAGEGELHLTIRAWDGELLKKNCLLMESMAKELSEEAGLKCDISYTQEFAANLNDDQAVAHIKNAVKAANLNSIHLQKAFKWGEDFGLFTQTIPGAMFGLGSGEDCPALHNPDYDFPDEITDTGIQIFHQIIQDIHA